MPQGPVSVVPLPSVREGIRGHVQDSHHVCVSFGLKFPVSNLQVWGLKYDGWSRNGADAPDNGAGGQGDSTMAQVIGESGLPCCLMHNRRDANYRDFVHDVIGDLEGTLRLAEQAGIGRGGVCRTPATVVTNVPSSL